MAKSLIELLEETYVELVEQENKFTDLRSKLEEILTVYYAQNPEEYIDTLISGKIVKDLLETGKLPASLDKATALDLTRYVVIQCLGRTPKGIKFAHVGAHEKKPWTANKFDSGLTPQFFKQGEFYIIYCTTAVRTHTWHWAQLLTEEVAVRTNNALKVPCKAVRNV